MATVVERDVVKGGQPPVGEKGKLQRSDRTFDWHFADMNNKVTTFPIS